jgi:two-component system alkaline phosphatase synthesis response regulator PhoP
MKARICLVEDDPTIQEIVSEKLCNCGYEVAVFSDAESVLMQPLSYDLLIVDIMLQGDFSGLDLCSKLRDGNRELPILILSALSGPQDRIEGLRMGADDYLGKPFEMEELLLRVEGMLRRRQWYLSKSVRGDIFQWDDCEVNFLASTGKKSAASFGLGQKECMIMKLLIEREGQTVSREEILEKVWGYDVFPSNRTVDNFMVRLRKCFEEDPTRPNYLQSVRGTGYRFVSESKGLEK